MIDPLYIELSENEKTHWWFVGRRAIIKRILDHFFPSESDLQILEQGCGTGGNFDLLIKYGNVSAFDTNPLALEFSSKHPEVAVKKGALPDLIPFDQKFDLICMFDVLEHVDDDIESLKQTQKFMKPEGKLLLTVPAYNFLWCKQDTLKHHKRRYLKSRFIPMLQENGFRIVYSTYYNTFLLPVICILRVVYKIIKCDGISDAKLLPKPINYILKKILSSEKYFFPKFSFPMGVSIFVLAEKSDTQEN